MCLNWRGEGGGGGHYLKRNSMTAVVAKRVVLCTLSGNAHVHVHYMTVPRVGDVGGNVVVCTCRVHELQRLSSQSDRVSQKYLLTV